MSHLPNPFTFAQPLLRLALVGLIVLALNLPHFGMVASAQPASMAMAHDCHGQNQPMDHTKGALCAMACVGADPVATFAPPARIESHAPASWDRAAALIWQSVPIGPAQRPPDPFRNL